MLSLISFEVEISSLENVVIGSLVLLRWPVLNLVSFLLLCLLLVHECNSLLMQLFQF